MTNALLTYKKALDTLFQNNTPPNLDADYIETLRIKCNPIAKQIPVIPFRGVVKLSDYLDIDQIHPNEYWETTLITDSARLEIPEDVYRKVLLATELGLPIQWYLWLEQFVKAPEVRYTQETIYKSVYRKYDPALVGLVRCGRGTGLPYLFGAWLDKKK